MKRPTLTLNPKISAHPRQARAMAAEGLAAGVEEQLAAQKESYLRLYAHPKPYGP